MITLAISMIIFGVVLSVVCYVVWFFTRPTGDDAIRANRENLAKVTNMRAGDGYLRR